MKDKLINLENLTKYDEELKEYLKKVYYPKENSKTYNLPLREASWVRIAKITDITKISNGIFVFNSYGIKGEEKRLFNSAIVAVSCGLDNELKPALSCLTLAATPKLTGKMYGEEEEEKVAMGGSGSSNSYKYFGINYLKLEEYEGEAWLCALINFPNVDLFESLDLEILIEHNINFSYLKDLEIVDLDYAIATDVPILEGATLKEDQDYSFILRSDLDSFLEIVQQEKPINASVLFEGDEEWTNLITYEKLEEELIEEEVEDPDTTAPSGMTTLVTGLYAITNGSIKVYTTNSYPFEAAYSGEVQGCDFKAKNLSYGNVSELEILALHPVYINFNSESNLGNLSYFKIYKNGEVEYTAKSYSGEDNHEYILNKGERLKIYFKSSGTSTYLYINNLTVTEGKRPYYNIIIGGEVKEKSIKEEFYSGFINSSFLTSKVTTVRFNGIYSDEKLTFKSGDLREALKEACEVNLSNKIKSIVNYPDQIPLTITPIYNSNNVKSIKVKINEELFGEFVKEGEDWKTDSLDIPNFDMWEDKLVIYPESENEELSNVDIDISFNLENSNLDIVFPTRFPVDKLIWEYSNDTEYNFNFILKELFIHNVSEDWGAASTGSLYSPSYMTYTDFYNNINWYLDNLRNEMSGRSKAKLVATETLTQNNSIENCYNAIYNMENNKFYLIQLINPVGVCSAHFTGMKCEDKFVSNYSFVPDSNKTLCLYTNYGADVLKIMDINGQNDISYINWTCKVYELPFTL